MTAPFAMNSFKGKQVLALVRDGDYAHAGEEEAIELTMAPIARDPDRDLLDAGCGLGGTAAYLQDHGWGRVTGFDIEPRAIEGARQTHPGPTFLASDIVAAPGQLDRRFDVITMFNVLYALPDQPAGLRALADVAAPGATLAIFDYVDTGAYQRDPLIDAGGPFLPQPVKREGVEGLLDEAGWRLHDSTPIDDAYIGWYIALVAKIEAKKEAIVAHVGTDGFNHVLGLYSGLLDRLRAGVLGGSLIYAGRAD
ncbi:MAG: class I SAM-dependent methyltransferase [Pseudomonadota bacterium]